MSLTFVWVTGEFPAQRASNAEKVSIWWRHHAKPCRKVWPHHHSLRHDKYTGVFFLLRWRHMNTMFSYKNNYQITSHSTVFFNRLCGPTSRKHQCPNYWPFVGAINWRPVNSPHKTPVTRQTLPFDDVIIEWVNFSSVYFCKQMHCWIPKPLTSTYRTPFNCICVQVIIQRQA